MSCIISFSSLTNSRRFFYNMPAILKKLHIPYLKCINQIEVCKLYPLTVCFSELMSYYTYSGLDRYILSSWQSSKSINLRLSAGPFFIILRSSGEKNTIFKIPNSSLAFLIGIFIDGHTLCTVFAPDACQSGIPCHFFRQLS